MNCIIDSILIAALKWIFFAYFLTTAFLTDPGKSRLSEHDNILAPSLPAVYCKAVMLYVGQHLQIEWRNVDGGTSTSVPTATACVIHLQNPKAVPHNL